jgi:malonyl-CoA O-methyltransferase
MPMTLTNKIRRTFTRAADRYDALTGLHQVIGRGLVQNLAAFPAKRILDIGCGTGLAAQQLRNFFPQSMIVGLDISEGMLQKAKQANSNISWLQADAQQMPFKPSSIDLAVSNLALQWVGNLEQSFRQIYKMLTPGGAFKASMFGANTCRELFSSFGAICPQMKFRQLPQLQDVRAALGQAGFKNIDVQCRLDQMEFKNAVDLLTWLKNIGANNVGDGAFLGKQTLEALNAAYGQKFPCNDGVYASFEVIELYGQK